ncbi:MAG: manganese efflux pump [Candidatus Aminicenantes bacterium]|nr:manganese efflux pump [Candidatus Aminicenantes bacterium]
MNFFEILAIALAMSMDTFAVTVGLSLSLKGLTIGQSARLALTFGSFQFGMAMLGGLAGSRIVRHIASYDHWVAAGLLFFVGGKMIWEFFLLRDGGEKKKNDPTWGGNLLLLALATSVDSLAVGLSLGTMRLALLFPAAVIGLVTTLVTAAASRIGPALGRLVGRMAELAGGAVLILIGVRVLVTHL